MSFLTLLNTVLIKPLQLVFEIIFMIAYRVVGHPALAIIVLSLTMNFLVLPLYRRADAMQEEARDIDNKLSRGIKHIKKSFSGDEKMMILQTYYRQNNYSPVNGLKGSVSLLLEIPFFIAAYQFLSHLVELQGVSFGPISNLGMPDGLISIAGISINLLPFLMTGINLVSSALFLKGFPLKSKIQLYGMAIFFLVFLYNSPAGLLFYWTLNNTFSLVKTIFYKIPNPRKVLSILASLVGIAIAAAGCYLLGFSRPKLLLACFMLACALQLPLIFRFLPKSEKQLKLVSDKKLFTICSCYMALLTGLLIPSAVLAASPTEFLFTYYYHNPLNYLLMSGLLAAGSFMVWLRIFYGLASEKAKAVFEALLFGLCFCMSANYLFFGTDFGIISNTLAYADVYTLNYSRLTELLNLLLMAVLCLGGFVLIWKNRNLAKSVLLTLCIVLSVMSVMNIFGINSALRNSPTVEYSKNMEKSEIKLSKDGKNVVVLMIDRAFGGYLPYFLEERPDLYEMYDGFTYYPNTVSFGSCTNHGVPPVLGGYEYTPIEINKRSDELLVDKHNEAAKLMPELFYNEGYDVTVCDVSHANFRYDPDMSIYDEYEGMNAYKLRAQSLDDSYYESLISNNYRNFFCFSMVKVLPPVLQNLLYFQGNYCQAANEYSYQVIRSDLLSAYGTSHNFIDDYSTLDFLPEITTSYSGGNSFLLLCNEASHDGALLQMPDYVPSSNVDNSAYVTYDKFYEYALENNASEVISFYHSNMSTILRLGEWFNYLRENDLYDNTRIIVVSDHGHTVPPLTELIVDSFGSEYMISNYSPILLVKDFNSTGFNVSNEFMTNADTATIAMASLIENPVNPFTGKAINSEPKFAGEQFIPILNSFNIEDSEGLTQFKAARWRSVKDNIFDINNWSYYDEVTVLPSAALG